MFKILTVYGYSLFIVFLGITSLSAQVPDRYPQNFSAIAEGVIVTLSWQEPNGQVKPDGYLIKVSAQGFSDIEAPDGVVADDVDFSDGRGAMTVQNGANIYSFYTLYAFEDYYFQIFPFTTQLNQRHYKTDLTPPSLKVTTGSAFISELFIAEFISKPGSGIHLEIYNGSGRNLDINPYHIVFKDANGMSKELAFPLNGVITHGGVFIVSNDTSTGWPGVINQRFPEVDLQIYKTIVLYKGDVKLDQIDLGQTGYVDVELTLRRNPNILQPNSVFDIQQWQEYGAAVYIDLGNHFIDCGCVDSEYYGKPIFTDKFELLGNYPNPFNPDTRIRFILPADNRNLHQVNISVFNVLGQEIATLFDGFLGSGPQEIRWNGVSNSGGQVPSGYYLYKIETGDNVYLGRMILLR